MKVLAIASAGGHWVQLLRLKSAFVDHELIFMSTKLSFADTVKGYSFYSIPDANRNKILEILKSAIKIWKLIKLIKPDVIITTGAAPGLIGLVVGRSVGAKTIWIDSIANVEEISMSGKIATKIADKVYTQWPHLANDKIIFNGSVLS